MTPQDALIELLERVRASQGAVVLVDDEELKKWPADAVKAIKTGAFSAEGAALHKLPPTVARFLIWCEAIIWETSFKIG